MEASECEIARGRLDGLFSCPIPICTALVEGSVEGIAILAAVLVCVAILIHILQWWMRMEMSELQNPYC